MNLSKAQREVMLGAWDVRASADGTAMTVQYPTLPIHATSGARMVTAKMLVTMGLLEKVNGYEFQATDAGKAYLRPVIAEALRTQLATFADLAGRAAANAVASRTLDSFSARGP